MTFVCEFCGEKHESPIDESAYICGSCGDGEMYLENLEEEAAQDADIYYPGLGTSRDLR